jgi:hypothetical protein
MLRVDLPSSILLPITADINGLIKILSGGNSLHEIHRAEAGTADCDYAGDSTFYIEPMALPKMEPYRLPIFATRAAAQAEKNRIAMAAYALREAKREESDLAAIKEIKAKHAAA